MNFNHHANFKNAQQRMIAMLEQSPIVTLIGNDRIAEFENTIQAAIQATPVGRVPAIEVLLRDESYIDEALQKLAKLKTQYGSSVHILIGSVILPQDIEKISQAGLDGAVSGGYSPDLAQAALQKGLPYLPGFMTLEEVKTAHEIHGLQAIKLFPARKPDMKSIMAPLARTGLIAYDPNDINMPKDLKIATTATEALKAWQQGEKQIIVKPAQTFEEWQAIIEYMRDNNMVACCTGGVTLANLHEFALENPIIGVGSSFIISAAEKENDFIKIITKTLLEANKAWNCTPSAQVGQIVHHC